MENEVNFQVLRQKFEDHAREHDNALKDIQIAFDLHEKEHKLDLRWKAGMLIGLIGSLITSVFSYTSGYGELKTSVAHLEQTTALQRQDIENRATKAELTAAIGNVQDNIKLIRDDIKIIRDVLIQN